MDNKKIGIILTAIGLVIVIIGIINLIPKKETYVEKVNNELNNEQLQFLIKEMEKYLPEAVDINKSTPYKLDEMLSFAFSYTIYLDTQNVNAVIDEKESLGIVDVEILKEKVKYLFDIDNIDIADSNYEIRDGKIYIPLNLQGGDAQIYKYVGTEYNEESEMYIATIDCLEPQSANDASTLLEKTEYDKDDVLFSLLIKYKVVEGRRILIAYSTYSNIEY